MGSLLGFLKDYVSQKKKYSHFSTSVDGENDTWFWFLLGLF